MPPSSTDIAGRLQRAAKDEDKYLDEIKADPHKARTGDGIENVERQFVVDLFSEWASSPGRPCRLAVLSAPRS